MFAYKTLKSGTDIRGVASEGGGAPINLTDEVVERIAAGFLVWCEKHLDKCAEGLKIAVGHDSRISADRIAAALFRAALQEGGAARAHTLSDVTTDGSECAGTAAAEDGAHSCAAEDAGAAGVCVCSENLRVLPYFDIFADLKQLPQGRILMDEKLVSYGIAVSVPEQVEKIAVPTQ